MTVFKEMDTIEKTIKEAEFHLRNSDILKALLIFHSINSHYLGRKGMAKCKAILQDFPTAIKLNEQAELLKHGYLIN
ncbi:MAG: hypothetical protein ACXAD7_03930 [Candidatus Kariarchaeaceae archaeon]|jgi:hypothetical protein